MIWDSGCIFEIITLDIILSTFVLLKNVKV
jgi:hypothetical protein